jgi:Tfp pilus assembly protein PilO
MSTKTTGNGSIGVRRWSEIDGAGFVAVVVMTMIFYFAALKPVLDARAIADAQRVELNAQEERASQAAASLQTARQRFEVIRKAIADNPLKLEPLRALNNRLARITAAATARGLEIADIRPSAAVSGTHYMTVPIALNGSGTFRATVGYLHDLHEQFGDIAVTSVKLAAANAQEVQGGGITFQLELLWHASSDQPGAAAAGERFTSIDPSSISR